MPDWEEIYSSKAKPAWDIGKPQKDLVEFLTDNKPSTAIDIGCGTGTSTIYMVKQGTKATGIDISKSAIAQAKKKSKKNIAFLVKDILKLDYSNKFDFAYDSGCFHMLAAEQRKKYASIVYKLLKKQGKLLLLCFSEHEPNWGGPNRIKKQELEETFSKLQIKWIKETLFEANDNGPAPAKDAEGVQPLRQFAQHKAYAMLAEKS